MPVVVPVKFAFSGRDLWFDPAGVDVMQADHAICKTERGTEIGLVTADPFEVPLSEIAAPLKPVLRVATDEDLDRADDLAVAGEDAMYDFRRLIDKNHLDMKPVGVEYLFGGEKAVFYFAAEDRIDFRQLVRDLSAYFHMRVDMRQIGVRDETRLVGGYAHCGQELCCARFGGNFEPVSIRMAKEQDLPLNSNKISGVCGRLMCCLRYEFEAYKDFKSRAPKKKTLIDTPLGKARIMEYDTPKEQLVLRLESGKVFRVNLADMTCSDACRKRAAEQGSKARPDCVGRDVLDRLESPELQLALLELDRKNGVDVGDGLDTADRIVASGPTPRRRRMREEEAVKFEGAQGAPRGQKGRPASEAPQDEDRRAGGRQPARPGRGAAPEPSGDAREPRRRRRPSADAEAAAQQAPQGRGGAPSRDGAPEAGQPSGRRRRRHVSEPGAQGLGRPDSRAEEPRPARDGAAPDGAAGKPGDTPGRSRRRRHISADEEPRAQRQRREQGARRSHKPSTPSVADQVSDGDVQVTRRRPGDGGGPGEGATGPDAPKKRRRRRSRKPRQDGGDTGRGGEGQVPGREP